MSPKMTGMTYYTCGDPDDPRTVIRIVPDKMIIEALNRNGTWRTTTLYDSMWYGGEEPDQEEIPDADVDAVIKKAIAQWEKNAAAQQAAVKSGT